MGFNVLGYQSHVLQRCHLARGHEASSYLTFSATEPRIKYLILSTNSRLRTSDEEITTINSSTWAKKVDRASYLVINVIMCTLFSSSLQQHMEGR